MINNLHSIGISNAFHIITHYCVNKFLISFQRYILNTFFCEIIYAGQMTHDNNSVKSSVYTRAQ